MSVPSYPDRQSLEEAYRTRRSWYQQVLETLEKEIFQRIEESGVRASIKGRVKCFESLYGKLLLKLSELDKEAVGFRGQKSGAPSEAYEELIQDLIGIRILTPFLESVGLLESLLREQYKVVEVERKGDEHSFREFGYRSVHLNISLPEGIACEVQIRTILQDAWAEVEHELVYKGSFSPFDEPMKRKLAALNATLSLSDIIFQEIRDYQRKLNIELQQRRVTFEKLIEQELPSLALELPATLPGIPTDVLSQDDEGLDMDSALLRALQTHNRGAYKEAVTLYNQILSGDLRPEVRMLTLVHRGMARFADSDYPGAEKDFSEAAGMGVRQDKPLYYLGILYRVTGRHQEALHTFLSVLQKDPYHVEALNGAAAASFQCGDYPASIDYCDRVLRLVPQDEKISNFRRQAAKKLGL